MRLLRADPPRHRSAPDLSSGRQRLYVRACTWPMVSSLVPLVSITSLATFAAYSACGYKLPFLPIERVGQVYSFSGGGVWGDRHLLHGENQDRLGVMASCLEGGFMADPASPFVGRVLLEMARYEGGLP